MIKSAAELEAVPRATMTMMMETTVAVVEALEFPILQDQDSFHAGASPLKSRTWQQ